eukprot:m.92394 g.92394  ORF g.92394 m.92394 type:complete len:218 (+) comp12035_c0_seq1:35-688(+)
MDCLQYWMYLSDSQSWDNTSSYTTDPDELLVRCSKYATGDGGLNAQYRICSMFEEGTGSCTGVDLNTAPYNAEPYSRMFNVLNGVSSTNPGTPDHQIWTTLRRPTATEEASMYLKVFEVGRSFLASFSSTEVLGFLLGFDDRQPTTSCYRFLLLSVAFPVLLIKLLCSPGNQPFFVQRLTQSECFVGFAEFHVGTLRFFLFDLLLVQEGSERVKKIR